MLSYKGEFQPSKYATFDEDVNEYREMLLERDENLRILGYRFFNMNEYKNLGIERRAVEDDMKIIDNFDLFSESSKFFMKVFSEYPESVVSHAVQNMFIDDNYSLFSLEILENLLGIIQDFDVVKLISARVSRFLDNKNTKLLSKSMEVQDICISILPEHIGFVKSGEFEQYLESGERSIYLARIIRNVCLRNLDCINIESVFSYLLSVFKDFDDESKPFLIEALGVSIHKESHLVYLIHNSPDIAQWIESSLNGSINQKITLATFISFVSNQWISISPSISPSQYLLNSLEIADIDHILLFLFSLKHLLAMSQCIFQNEHYETLYSIAENHNNIIHNDFSAILHIGHPPSELAIDILSIADAI